MRIEKFHWKNNFNVFFCAAGNLVGGLSVRKPNERFKSAFEEKLNMRFWYKHTPVLAASALAVLVMAGCNEHLDKLGDIARNPSGFVNKDVTVAGEVTKVYELPLGIADIAAYRVNDGTGQAWVISRAGAPREGDKVGLKGTVRPEGRIGGEVLTNIIEEKQRKVQ